MSNIKSEVNTGEGTPDLFVTEEEVVFKDQIEVPETYTLEHEEASEDPDIADEDVKITVTTSVPTISTPRDIKLRHRFGTGHKLTVVNNSKRGFEATLYYEWVIPGAKKFRGYERVYCPKKKTTTRRRQLLCDWFYFQKEGTYQMTAGTVFKGEDNIVKSNTFEVKKLK